MSELTHSARGGEYATSPRSRVAEDAAFIMAQRVRGVPVSAIARMTGRSVTDVQAVVQALDLAPVPRADAFPSPPAAPPVAPKPKRVVGARKPQEERVWKRRTPPRRAMPTRVREIVEKIASHYGVTVEELIGDSKIRAIATIRNEAWHTLYETGRYSSPAIGSWFGGRDHTTILAGIGRHEKRLGLLNLEDAA